MAKPDIIAPPPVPTTVAQLFALLSQLDNLAQPDNDVVMGVLRQTPFETLLPSAKAGKMLRALVRRAYGQNAS